ncbi:DsbA family oxidoreductase [Kiloniella laminariae]|uniref:DsbA family oxidoreductase n=1 Tax=Kiloniella laminariae TaxID=454162 RepID=UPI00035FC7D4|nr:DsbA family oxidoreductase [Kiloniella laminariae]
MTKATIEIDIYSDPICPWCYIGLKRFRKAQAMRPDFEVKTRWLTFQLNPDMPLEGMERQSYLDSKFGGRDNATQFYNQIASTGREEGIDFKFDLIRKTPNTVDAHRLSLLARSQDKQDALMERLFECYFLEGQNIGERSVLLEIAQTTGLTGAAEYLDSDQGHEEVLFTDQNARSLGLNGVPCFIVNRQHILPGAQNADTLAQMLDIGYQQQLEQP